jgi:1-deoxy-D-xylulose-5-phosphate synthase
MEKDPSVIAVVAAVPSTIRFDKNMRRRAGKQFIDVDIAEQHALSMVAGISKNGGKPIFVTDATFYQRAYDQIAQDICINKCPVTMLMRNASVWAANDVTHLGWFDISAFSNIPNLVFLAPTNCEEYFAMLDWSIEQTEHPVIIRIPRNGVHHADIPVDKDYNDLNKNLTETIGENVAILAVGDFFQMGTDLASVIKKELGFQPTLINPRFVNGLDIELLDSLLGSHKVVITLEDGILDGGYGQKVASFYGSASIKVLNYGLRKEFLDGYKASEVLSKYGITNDSILNDLKKNLYAKL